MGKKYLNQFQDEPQSLFWYHTQTVTHPIINYYICPQCAKKIVTDEHIIISDNIKHYKQAVRTFEEASLGFLASEGIVPMKKIQFCNNCSQQYKSRWCFYYMSKSDVPSLRCYFGAHHSKGTANGCVGQVKSTATRDINSREALIKDAKSFYGFMVQKLEKPHPGNGKCFPDHFHQMFFYITDFTTKDPLEQNCETSKGTQKIHSVRTNDKEMEIEARLVPCLCPQCLSNQDGTCPNKEYRGNWIPYDLIMNTGESLILESTKKKMKCQKRK